MSEMKLLSGSELVGYIKERQAKQVRGLRQAHGIFPKLAIIQTIDNPVIDTYVRLKQRYGEDILIDVELYKVTSEEAVATINGLNQDDSVHAIIVQLPLADPSQTDEILNAVTPEKDVDGLSENTQFDAATALAINWLLAGYNVDLKKHSIAVVGQGRLVGAPLTKMWRNSGYEVQAIDRSTENMAEKVRQASLIVSGTGSAGIITSDMVQQNAVIVDAGTSSDSGEIRGDVAPEVYERDDIKITPQKGGVGPLTVAALFDNVIRAAQRRIKRD